MNDTLFGVQPNTFSPFSFYFTWYQLGIKLTPFFFSWFMFLQMASPDTNSSTLTFESNGTNGSFDPHYPSPVSFKLEGPNYLGWQSLFLPFLRSNSLLEFVDGSKPTPNKDLPDNTLNPTYGIWFRKDQALLGCIPSSIIETLVSILYGLDSSYKVWNTFLTRFSSQSRSRITHIKR